MYEYMKMIISTYGNMMNLRERIIHKTGIEILCESILKENFSKTVKAPVFREEKNLIMC